MEFSLSSLWNSVQGVQCVQRVSVQVVNGVY